MFENLDDLAAAMEQERQFQFQVVTRLYREAQTKNLNSPSGYEERFNVLIGRWRQSHGDDKVFRLLAKLIGSLVFQLVIKLRQPRLH